MVLGEKTLDGILNYLDDSVVKLSGDLHAASEFHMDGSELEIFLSDQYDVRLNNLLEKNGSGIHHLESGLKNKVILRKQKLLDSVLKNQKSR